jgi:hypothetical protein
MLLQGCGNGLSVCCRLQAFLNESVPDEPDSCADAASFLQSDFLGSSRLDSLDAGCGPSGMGRPKTPLPDSFTMV